MSATDSFNGQLNPTQSCQWSYISWFSSNSFSFGNFNNYTNTPVGAVVHVFEPGPYVENRYVYFGNWAAGSSFVVSAWDAFLANPVHYECAAIGDPFTMK